MLNNASCRATDIGYNSSIFAPIEPRFVRLLTTLGYGWDIALSHAHVSILFYMVKTGKTTIEMHSPRAWRQAVQEAVTMASNFSLTTIVAVCAGYKLHVVADASDLGYHHTPSQWGQRMYFHCFEAAAFQNRSHWSVPSSWGSSDPCPSSSDSSSDSENEDTFISIGGQ